LAAHKVEALIVEKYGAEGQEMLSAFLDAIQQAQK
jgi:hypothetical protein